MVSFDITKKENQKYKIIYFCNKSILYIYIYLVIEASF